MKDLLESWNEFLTEEEPLEEKKKKKKKKKAKKDACYHKVRSRYKVWPSAYASGALVKCRKVGAKNWGNKSKKNEEVELEPDSISLEEKKKKKAGTESSKESSLRDWFGRKGAKGSKKGWVDCNAPDGDGGYKSCGRGSGEKRKKYPACRPTPGACKERGKGKSWGKKAKSKKNEAVEMRSDELYGLIAEEVNRVLLENDVFPYLVEAFLDDGTPVCVGCLAEQLDTAACGCPDLVYEAEYQGRKVTLNKPTRGDVKKFKVYVKDPKTGNVKKVNFGDKKMRIKKSNPKRRKSFRARHNCDNPGPKTKARYWSCKKW